MIVGGEKKSDVASAYYVNIYRIGKVGEIE